MKKKHSAYNILKKTKIYEREISSLRGKLSDQFSQKIKIIKEELAVLDLNFPRHDVYQKMQELSSHPALDRRVAQKTENLNKNLDKKKLHIKSIETSIAMTENSIKMADSSFPSYKESLEKSYESVSAQLDALVPRQKLAKFEKLSLIESQTSLGAVEMLELKGFKKFYQTKLAPGSFMTSKFLKEFTGEDKTQYLQYKKNEKIIASLVVQMNSEQEKISQIEQAIKHQKSKVNALQVQLKDQQRILSRESQHNLAILIEKWRLMPLAAKYREVLDLTELDDEKLRICADIIKDKRVENFIKEKSTLEALLVEAHNSPEKKVIDGMEAFSSNMRTLNIKIDRLSSSREVNIDLDGIESDYKKLHTVGQHVVDNNKRNLSQVANVAVPVLTGLFAFNIIEELEREDIGTSLGGITTDMVLFNPVMIDQLLDSITEVVQCVAEAASDSYSDSSSSGYGYSSSSDSGSSCSSSSSSSCGGGGD